jgi:hypothetical protein
MVKTYIDYLDQMHELFPEVDIDYIEDIIKHGLNNLVMWTADGHDFAIDYKWPKSSMMIADESVMKMTKFKKIKLNRKNQ